MVESIIAALAALGLLILAFWRQWGQFRKSDASRPSALTLAVQSGLLAALAILTPLAAASSPWSRRSDWHWWLLATVLVSAVVCMFGTIYGMMQLQNADSFALKDHPAIPCWNNATWVSMILLAFTVVGPILGGAEAPGARLSGGPAGARFAVTRDLPVLHVDQKEIITAWGIPAYTKDWGLVYKTNGSIVVFCLDHDGRTQKIIETQEETVDALGTFCK